MGEDIKKTLIFVHRLRNSDNFVAKQCQVVRGQLTGKKKILNNTQIRIQDNFVSIKFP